MRPHICAWCLFFLAQIRKTRGATYENVGHVLCKISNRDISVGLPAKIDDLVPASQVRLQQFRVHERFWVEGSNKRSDREAH